MTNLELVNGMKEICDKINEPLTDNQFMLLAGYVAGNNNIEAAKYKSIIENVING